MVLLHGACCRKARTAHGVCDTCGGDSAPAIDRIGIVRPSFPESRHPAEGGIRESDRLAASARPEEEGNSVFVDADFRAIGDQWAALSNVRRLSPGVVQEIASRYQVDAVIRPRKPRGSDRKTRGSESDPRGTLDSVAEVPFTWDHESPLRVIRSNVLTLSVLGFDRAIVQQVMNVAAFHNPEYFKRQALRLTTARTPRFIQLADHVEDNLVLPRGTLDEVMTMVRGAGGEVVVDDRRAHGHPIAAEFEGTLYASQEAALSALLAFDDGILVAPPGSGKTVIAASLIARRRVSTLIVVHTQTLLEQWVARLKTFLLPETPIGVLSGAKKKRSGVIDVAMIQSLMRVDDLEGFFAAYGQVIVDECHHAPAVSFDRVFSLCASRYLVGLTATPKRRDGHHPIIQMRLGPIRHTLISARQSSEPSRIVKVRVVPSEDLGGSADVKIQEVYRRLSGHAARNALILDDILSELAEGRFPLVLLDRRDHLDFISESLANAVPNRVVLHGGLSAKARRDALDRLAQFGPIGDRLILATGRYVGEGFDDSRLDTLVLATPVSWRGTLIQYVGRLNRDAERTREVRVYDYVDRGVTVLERMFDRRKRGYRAIGFDVIDEEVKVAGGDGE